MLGLGLGLGLYFTSLAECRNLINLIKFLHSANDVKYNPNLNPKPNPNPKNSV
jgi:hypothetical protein